MKKRIWKGIFVLAAAVISVCSVPQMAAQDDTADFAITAEAASSCSHNYRHYGTYSDWKFYQTTENGRVVSAGYYRYYYSVCANCGHKDVIRIEYTGKGWN